MLKGTVLVLDFSSFIKKEKTYKFADQKPSSRVIFTDRFLRLGTHDNFSAPPMLLSNAPAQFDVV